MYVILIDYTSGLDEIDSALDAHKAWLDENYSAGRFLASGRRKPRTGAVILAADGPRDEIEDAVAHDPFAVQGLAEHTIVEFHPSRFGSEPFAEHFSSNSSS